MPDPEYVRQPGGEWQVLEDGAEGYAAVDLESVPTANLKRLDYGADFAPFGDGWLTRASADDEWEDCALEDVPPELIEVRRRTAAAGEARTSLAGGVPDALRPVLEQLGVVARGEQAGPSGDVSAERV